MKHPVMLWDQHSGKWHDRGNNYFVREMWSGKWQASARYDFYFSEITKKEYGIFSTMEFDTEKEALRFVTDYLALREARLMLG